MQARAGEAVSDSGSPDNPLFPSLLLPIPIPIPDPVPTPPSLPPSVRQAAQGWALRAGST